MGLPLDEIQFDSNRISSLNAVQGFQGFLRISANYENQRPLAS